MSVRLSGAAILLIAALYTWLAQDYTAGFGDVLGPSVFPTIVGIPAMILAASLIVFPSGQVDWAPRPRIAAQIGAVAVLIAYAWLLKPLGFPLATFGLVSALAVLMGGRWQIALPLGLGSGLGLWVLFDQILGLPLAFLGSLFS